MNIKGEVPIFGVPGAGCPFAARCPHVMDICRQVMPPVTTLSDTRWVRCYLYGENEGQKTADKVSAN